ncbi:MAG: hypothetical protein R6V10_15805 [bacterium]
MAFKSREDLVNKKPVLNVDFCSQYYWAYAAREFYEADSKLWGYDPYFMAGYPLDFVFNSALPVQLTAVMAEDANLARLIKVCFVASILLVPLTLYFGLSQFGIGRGPALAAAALGLAYFWAGENSFLAHMGMISGAFLLHFFLVPAGLLMRFLHERANRPFSFLIFAVPIAFTIHKTAFVLVLPLAVIWVLFYSRKLSGRELFMIAGVFVLAAIFNLHWLYPFFKYLHLKVEDPGTTFFQSQGALQALKDLAAIPGFHPYFGTPLVRLVILITGIIGFVRLARQEHGMMPPLVIGIVFLGIISYFGSYVETLKHLQPYRYVTAYFYLWLPAAGIGLKVLYDRAAVFKGGEIGGPLIFAGGLILILALLPSFIGFSRVAPLTTEMDKPSQEVVSWVKNNTDPGARLLIEDINEWDTQPGEKALYGGARLVHLLPLLVQRQLVGGPLPNAFIKHHYAGFHDGEFLNEPVKDMTDRVLDRAMRDYNIGWVVAWTQESRERFADYEPTVLEKSIDPFDCFRIDREHSYFLQGSGKVKAEFNRIHLSELQPESGKVKLSYHFANGLHTEPDSKVKGTGKGPDPVGFITIEDPPKKMVLQLGR